MKNKSLLSLGGKGLGSFLKFLFLLGFFLLVSIDCKPKDYYLLQPIQSIPEICRESEIFDRGQLRVHWIAYYPEVKERSPAVLVHPDVDGLSSDMEGICLALAQRGYFAAAAHYQRLENLRQKNPLIAYKSLQEGTTAYKHLREHSRADAGRIGLLGFSKGGTQSLLIAAVEPEVKAVVAYYPLTDLEEWLDVSRHYFPRSVRLRAMRSHIMRGLGVSNWEEALTQLRTASPVNHVGHIQSPVLLVHGDEDRTVPLGQSERLCRKLKAAGKDCELFVVPGGGHIFNFRDKDLAEIAWDETLLFLDGHLKRNPHRPCRER